MDAIAMFRVQMNGAHDIVEGTIDNVTNDQCHHIPGGKAHPIGATYAHIVMSEDFIVNMMLRGSTPLLMGEWAGKTGASEPPPPPGGEVFAWANRVQVDLAQTREYAKAVYKNTDDYLNTLSAEDLDRIVDIPGLGKQPLAYFLSLAAIIHPSNHIGEVSALKGIQGAQGYPF